MFVKPAEGRAPRDPRSMLRIPEEGIPIGEHDPHFAMLLRDGDVVEAEPPKEAEPAAQATTAPGGPASESPEPVTPSAAAGGDEAPAAATEVSASEPGQADAVQHDHQ